MRQLVNVFISFSFSFLFLPSFTLMSEQIFHRLTHTHIATEQNEAEEEDVLRPCVCVYVSVMCGGEARQSDDEEFPHLLRRREVGGRARCKETEKKRLQREGETTEENKRIRTYFTCRSLMDFASNT